MRKLAKDGNLDKLMPILEARIVNLEAGVPGGAIAGMGAQGRTALHMAASGSHLTTLEALMTYGANPNAQDDANGFDVLTVLVEKGCGGLSGGRGKDDIRCARALLRNGADPTLKDKHGYSALFWAKQWEIWDMYDVLYAHQYGTIPYLLMKMIDCCCCFPKSPYSPCKYDNQVMCCYYSCCCCCCM